MTGKTVLVVDDEKDIAELIEYNLKKEGYKTVSVLNGEDALREARRIVPDLIILDLMLPGIDGFDVCKTLKQEKLTRKIPVLMLTAKGDDMDQIVGLEIGADDYVTKPFSPKVLLTRIKKIIQRNADAGKEEPVDEVISVYGLQIDPERHLTLYNGKKLDLSVTEFELLRLLACMMTLVEFASCRMTNGDWRGRLFTSSMMTWGGRSRKGCWPIRPCSHRIRL